MLGTSDPTINSKALAAKQGGITAMNPFVSLFHVVMFLHS